MAEPMEMLFGCRLLGPNNYLLYWGAHWCQQANALFERFIFCAATMQLLVRLFDHLCHHLLVPLLLFQQYV